MTRTYYGLSELDGYHSHEGELCVIVSGQLSGGDNNYIGYIYNITTKGEVATGFIGASICRYISSQYILNIEHTQYQYDKKGNPTNSAAIGTKLYLGTILNPTVAAGNVIKSNTVASVSTTAMNDPSADPGTRASIAGTASTDTSITYQDINNANNYRMIINSMNVRDEFANNALRGIIANIPNVTSLSKNEISYYCEQAYKWAEYMMTSCANTRGSYSLRSGSGTVNTNNTDTEQYLQELVNGISQSSQVGFTIQTDGSIKVNDNNSATYANGATFNFKVEPGLLSKINDSYIWTSNASTNVGGIITSWANQMGILKWSDLTTADATKKIDVSHLPSVGGTFWGNQWSLGESIDGSIKMGSRAVISTKVTPSGGTEIDSQILGLNSSNQLVLGFEKNDSLTHSTYIDGTSIRFRYAEGTGRNEALQIGSVVDTRDQYHHGIDSNNPTRITAIKPFEFKTNIYLDQYSLHVGKQLSSTVENPPTGSIRLEQGVPIQYYIESNSNANYGFKSVIISNNNEIAFGYGTRRYRRTVISGGGEIDFTVANIDNGQTETEPKEDNVLQVVYATNNKSYVKVKNSLRIGDAELTWDSSNNALKLQRYDNNPADFYATGGVSAIMQSSDSSSNKKIYFDTSHYLYIDNTGRLIYNNAGVEKLVTLSSL